jgi:glycosyltransferase involved in cell wall biosynthesis
MKIVMFTPTNRESAIGGCASLIGKALLGGGHELIIVRAESAGFFKAETHDFNAELVRWDNTDRVNEVAQAADLILYQIGDNYHYHAGCLEWIEKWPGIVCLHDFFLGHLFWGWAESHREQAGAILRTWYGDDTARSYFLHNDSKCFIEQTREVAPMTEWICSLAYGVITHSNWGVKRVLDSCPGPVRVVSLCHNKPIDAQARPVAEVRKAPSIFRVLTIGHANLNKRIPSVIEAVGSSAILKEKTVYQLVGSITPEYRKELIELASSFSVKLEILGEVDNATLAKRIDEADVISCLRWPALEAASGSLIEALMHGKATIVTDTGFYSELPGELVVKINPHDEIPSIRTALELIHANPERKHEMGQDAKVWAATEFTAENYARKVCETGILLGKCRPVIRMTDFYAHLMERYGYSEEFAYSEDVTAPLLIFGNADLSKSVS